MRKLFIFVLTFLAVVGLALPVSVRAQETATPAATPLVEVKPDITQKTPETLGPLEEILMKQKLGPVWPSNPIKYAIKGAVGAGVPVNTIILLLLLPIVALVIAVARNVIGIRGFGIFLPASLSVVFVAIGPEVGIGLFLLIVAISTTVRILFKKLKIQLQYLPRMALILWAVSFGVLAVLFLAPVVRFPQLANVSIFAVLILVLLAEDFTRVQLGKSAKTAIGITTETLILSLLSFLFLTLKPLREAVLLNPEVALLVVVVLDFVLARYSGLRLMEIWRFRKLIKA